MNINTEKSPQKPLILQCIIKFLFLILGKNGPNSTLKGQKSSIFNFYLGDMVTGTVDQEINTVSGRVGTLCIC